MDQSSVLTSNTRIPAELAGRRLDQALAELFSDYSRSRLTAWIKAGDVLVDGAVAVPRQIVRGGEEVTLRAQPTAEVPLAPEAIALDIRYEDADLLVINKPSGLTVHPGAGQASGTLQNALLHFDATLAGIPRAGIVHRLDKETSGLLVVAKSLEAQTSLVRQLQTRTVKREYLALVHGKVTRAGKVDAPIGRHPTLRTRMAVASRGRASTTHYEVLRNFAHATLLRCRLETGRTHQIRVHMQSLGHPLVGDPVYGRKRSADPTLAAFSRQALHAERLEFEHPASGKPVAWKVDPPADLRALLGALEAQ
jgi:23S rRNA pseudouridine1911/1915/1917 synthase